MLGDGVGIKLFLIAQVCSRSLVSLLESRQIHAMANKDMVRKTPLIELNIGLVVVVLLLVKEVLLSALGHLICHDGVTFMEFGLGLGD